MVALLGPSNAWKRRKARWGRPFGPVRSQDLDWPTGSACSTGEAGGAGRNRPEFVGSLDVRDRAVHERGPVQLPAPQDAAQLDVVAGRDREDRRSAVPGADARADDVLAQISIEGSEDEDVHTRRRDLTRGPPGRPAHLVNGRTHDRRAFADDPELARDRERSAVHPGRPGDEPLVCGDGPVPLAVRAVAIPAQVADQADRTLHQ